MVLKQKGYMILIYVMLTIVVLIVLDISVTESNVPAVVAGESTEYTPSLPTEADVFDRDEFALDYLKMPDPEDRRDLESYYANRAYSGAPPTIPHVLLSEGNIGGKNCLQCHENGGYVAQFEKYAPVTPHPEYINCLQCHVPVNTEETFKKAVWHANKGNERGETAMQGSPPVIPHQLQLRSNCLACHAGPAAPKEIKVSHPERVNCMQCHAQTKESTIEWTRNEK